MIAKLKPIRVNVTARDLRIGRACDCFECPVALALQRATGDNEAQVNNTLDGDVWLEAWGRMIEAPPKVRLAVRAVDHGLRGGVTPFRFTLPAITDPRWKEECQECGEICEQGELDDNGCCAECAAK